MREARFMIAGMVYDFRADESDRPFVMPECYRPFLHTNGNGQDNRTIKLRSHGGVIPEWTGELLFDSRGPWRIWNVDGGYAISLHSTASGDDPYRVAFLDADFKTGKIYSDPVITREEEFPFGYPLDEVLAINNLALGIGLEIHACGVSHQGEGYLFTGMSGAGKSTISYLWAEDRENCVLSDDRIIITPSENGFMMHGTPWHGEARMADPSGVPLKAIFFINHGSANKAERLEPVQALSRLIVRTFPTFWSKQGMQFTTDLALSISQQKPCFNLEFVPERSIIDYLKSIEY